MKFNSDQFKAIHQDPIQSHCLVLAGAGSGKTAVLIHRLMHLIEADFQKIWCITFTRKAALEMRERFGAILNEAGNKSCKELLKKGLVDIKLETFHIFAREIICECVQDLPKNLDEWTPLATQLLQSHFRILKPHLPQIILVDEFQDINKDQLLFCQALQVKHLFAVGDDDQAIYGFRGSQVEIILQLQEYFEPLETIYLCYNYRSRQTILNLANQLFPNKNMLRKNLISDRPLNQIEGKYHQPQWRYFKNSSSKNHWIVSKILQLKRTHSQLKWNDFAILVRLNQLVLYYQEALAFLDIPTSNISCSGVEIMTIHASKGLQFPIVFIADLNESIFPHMEYFTVPQKFTPEQNKKDWIKLRFAEEECLFYVAITRAESMLYLLHCKQRIWRGQMTQFKPSPFFKLRYTKDFKMLLLFKIRCVAMVNLFMVSRIILFLLYLFSNEKKKSLWVEKQASLWAKFVLKYLNFDLKVNGQENIYLKKDRHLFVVSNHISWGDIPAILHAYPFVLGFVAKMELTKIPILNYWMKKIGCIFVNRKKHREAMRALQSLEKDDQFTRIVLFPEGTRSKDGRIGPLKPGGLKIAWSLGALVQPTHISGTRDSWESRLNTAENLGTINILPPIDLKKMKEEGLSFDEFLSQMETTLRKENGEN